MKKFLCLILLLIPFVSFGQGGLVYLFAGNGSSSAENVPATNAHLSDWFPSGAADAAGNIYLVTNGFNKVRKVDAATGIITTVAGTGISGFSGDGGPATAAALDSPYGVGIDQAGNIYIADKGNNRIRKVAASTGIITTIAGCGTCGISGDGVPATSVQITQPRGNLAFDPYGNLLIPDYAANKVSKVNATTGIITTVAGCDTCNTPNDGAASTIAKVTHPSTILTDGAGNIYISSDVEARIRKVDGVTGTISTFAGNGISAYTGDYGPATAASIGEHMGMCMDPGGNIIIAGYGKLRSINKTSGIISPIGGGGMTNPWGGIPLANVSWGDGPMLADRAGNIFVSCSLFVSKITSIYTTFSSDSFSVSLYSDCVNTQFSLVAPHYYAGMTVTTYFGDATSATTPFTGVAGLAGTAGISHAYAASGTYNIKNVLNIGGTPVDSVSYAYTFAFCNEVSAQFYYDNNSNCAYEPAIDNHIYLPTLVEISVNGMIRDTVSATNGFTYAAYGNPNDVVN